MFENIASITITGKNFNNNSFGLFKDDKQNYNMVIVYGKNGSGKSTISSAFKKIKGENITFIENSELIDIENNRIVLDENKKNNIFVFDEEFINNNIRIKQDGLDSIVMIGNSVKIDDKIEEINKIIAEYEIEHNKQDEKLKQYDDVNTEGSIMNLNIKMQLKLSNDGSWADRDKAIKGNKINSKVSENTYLKFINRHPNKNRDELVIKYDEYIKKLNDAKNGAKKIDVEVKTIDKVYDDKLIIKLLKEKIIEPQLSEREEYLLNLLKNDQKNFLDKIVTSFEDDKLNFCPFCMRDINSYEKRSAVDSVKNILVDNMKRHLNDLHNAECEEIHLDLSCFTMLGKEKDDCEEVLKDINKVIVSNNNLLKKKYSNPYTPMDCPETNVNGLITELNTLLKKLEGKRLQYNKDVTDVSGLQNILHDINDDIAYYDIKDLYSIYKNKLDDFDKDKEQYNNLNKIINEKRNELNNYIVELKSIKIAIDEINKSLSYIFLSNNRIRIEPKNDKYVILVNGAAVLPNQISVGERNVLALCYFFTKLLNNKKNSYDEQYLIIIDDPISSFDFENKVGIMSFLKYKLEEVLFCNKFSRALVLSHDLVTIYDLYKICEVFTDIKESDSDKFRFKCLELNNCQLEDFKYKKRQEYTQLLQIAYNYIINNAEDKYDIVIGNILRQVLEAFTTFMYKSGIDAINSDEILKNVKNDNIKEYFKNLMCRLIMHGGSHREEQVKTMQDLNLFSVASKDEKIRIAKSVLCFIYIINKEHIMIHLKNNLNDNSVYQNFESWIEEINKL